ncbi:MAG: MBL fold metallo-hydrolase [Planctomycetia bacterium]|nr:MBL fold metallo-hydrolase [Planctomycetia bacterium]
MAAGLKIVVTLPLEENTAIVWAEGNSECVVIDPGLEPRKILEEMQNAHLQPVAFLCTHGHADHVGGLGVLKQKFLDVPIYIGEKDADKLTNPAKNLSTDFGVPLVVPPAEVLLKGGETLTLAGMKINVFATPGHSAGHCVFLFPEMTPPAVFVGDLIFYNSIGRSDFFDGDPLAQEKSIRDVIYTLPDDTILHCGHGPSTTVGIEKKTNPFLRGV